MKTFSKEAYTGRNNKEEQDGTPHGINISPRTECEEHNIWLSTRCNDCIVLFKKPCTQYGFNDA